MYKVLIIKYFKQVTRISYSRAIVDSTMYRPPAPHIEESDTDSDSTVFILLNLLMIKLLIYAIV